MNRHIAITLCILIICASTAQAASENPDMRPILLPTPKNVKWLDGKLSLSAKSKAMCCIISTQKNQNAINTGITQINERITAAGMTSITVVQNADTSKYDVMIWVGTPNDFSANKDILGNSFALPKDMCVPDGYVLKCAKVGKRDVVICAGYDARGCYYGLQTLIQLISVKGDSISIPRVDITDWPTFSMRLVKVSPTGDPEENINRCAKLLPRYKMNMLAAQFQPRGNYPGTWRKPDPQFMKNSETIASEAKQTNSYDALMYYGPFGPKRGSLVDPEVTNGYVDKLLYWISRGYTWIGIDYNDFFDSRSVTKEELEKIGDLGDIMAKVTNETYKQVRAKYPNVGFVSVPSNGHYKNATPEDVKYCKSIPEDILVASAGDRKAATEYSDPVTTEFLNGWAEKTGRKPYLWDNCLYRQMDNYAPLIQRIYNFEAYANRFPADMPKLIGGPAIHLNGSSKRWWEPGVLTFLDYMWNPEAYDAKTSLRNARVLLWGKQGADAAENAQRLTSELYTYLYNVNAKKVQGSEAEAQAKYADAEKAVKQLAAVLGDPITAKELDEDCLGKLKGVLTKVYPTKKVQ